MEPSTSKTIAVQAPAEARIGRESGSPGKRAVSAGAAMHRKRLVQRAIVVGALLVAVAFMGALLLSQFRTGAGESRGDQTPAVPVEVGEITRQTLRDIRTLSGTLEANSRSLIATRIAGRVERMLVNIGDVVESNDVIAILDDAELRQAVDEASAELQVAQATLAESESNLVIAERNFRRVERLFNESIASEAELDTVRAEFEAMEARVRVSKSQVARAEAQLRAEEVRLSYATVNAIWPNPNGPRIIGERFVDEGSTVAANGAVVSLLDIDTLIAVIYVAERDYARLRIGQAVSVTSESHRGEVFQGEAVRLAPEFRQASRQARVEVELENRDHRLKPGMFIRAEVELARADDAVAVPKEAIVRRRGTEGVFRVDETTMKANFVPLTFGISEGNRVQVLNPPDRFDGEVVTLGHHLIDDGSTIRISREEFGSSEESGG